jgi:hypothetical protein
LSVYDPVGSLVLTLALLPLPEHAAVMAPAASTAASAVSRRAAKRLFAMCVDLLLVFLGLDADRARPV